MKTMTKEEKLAWGRAEWAEREKAIAAIKAGTMTLEDAMKAANRRSRASGMHPGEAFSYMAQAERATR